MKKKQAAETGDAAVPADALFRQLHPRLAKWFRASYPAVTHAQELALPSILQRASILPIRRKP